jgi:hypothetical protein
MAVRPTTEIALEVCRSSSDRLSPGERPSSAPIDRTVNQDCRVQFKVSSVRPWYRENRKIDTDTIIEIVQFNSAYSVATVRPVQLFGSPDPDVGGEPYGMAG